jgi:DNA (cytosine-5)-methyltransferase 1
MRSMRVKSQQTKGDKTVADFFAGIGLVTQGLNMAGWDTVYALDYDKLKQQQYEDNFGKGHYYVKDVAEEKGSNVPNVRLAHASFPCTDLSLAGARKGIYEGESKAFWEFARILREMKQKYGDENPNFILIENVEGLLTSHDGADLYALLKELNALGYRVDLLRINANHFVPQSRVRIFIIGVHNSLVAGFDETDLIQLHNMRTTNARPRKIQEYIARHSDVEWYFHDLPNLPTSDIRLQDIIDPQEEWWSEERTQYLYNQLHSYQRELVDEQVKSEQYKYYAGFRRMRVRDGKRQSTVELRNDDIAGCLRTPKGGSARQIVVRAGNGKFDARLFNAREAARLMGANDFVIGSSVTLNQALFGFGDAVCVPALGWLGEHYFNTLIEQPQAAVETVEAPSGALALNELAA